MAFFGLTALGANSPFASQFKNGFTVALFELDEFGDEYDKLAASLRRPVTLADIPILLASIFRGPPPAGEMERVMTAFSAAGVRSASMIIERELFLASIDALRSGEAAAIAAERERAAHYVSLDLLQEHRQRHVPAMAGPADTFIAPLTLGQDSGWRGYELPSDKRHPKKSCAETKFQALLAASGYL